jgi:hypothetical protein
MNKTDAVQGQGVNEADDSDDDEYSCIVPEAADRALHRWHARKQAKIIQEIEVKKNQERLDFFRAIEHLNPTDLRWACELMSYLVEEVYFIEMYAAKLKSGTTR